MAQQDQERLLNEILPNVAAQLQRKFPVSGPPDAPFTNYLRIFPK